MLVPCFVVRPDVPIDLRDLFYLHLSAGDPSNTVAVPGKHGVLSVFQQDGSPGVGQERVDVRDNKKLIRGDSEDKRTHPASAEKPLPIVAGDHCDCECSLNAL